MSAEKGTTRAVSVKQRYMQYEQEESLAHQAKHLSFIQKLGVKINNKKLNSMTER